jgi:hydrogenase large subunit
MQCVLTDISNFIDSTYCSDVITVATQALSADILAGSQGSGRGIGCQKYIAYGTFPQSSGNPALMSGFVDSAAALDSASPTTWTTSSFTPDNIREYISYSYYDEGVLGDYNNLHPGSGVTKPNYSKAGAYSFLKAPRYVVGTNVHVAEVGPLARALVNYFNNTDIQNAVDNFITGTYGVTGLNSALGDSTTVIPLLRSVVGRHACRYIETKYTADAMSNWINQLTTQAAGSTGVTYTHRNLPRVSATGYGLTEAPRGALGHWIRVDGRKISNYQCVVPSTWNLGPKDTLDQQGPVEQAIEAVRGVNNDVSSRVRVGRIVRSFDPCIACAVHIVTPDKKTVTKFEIDPNK